MADLTTGQKVGLGTAAGAGAVGLASLFGDNSTPMPDISGLTDIINQKSAEQQGYLGNLPGQIQKNNADLSSGLSTALGTANAETGSAAKDFLSSLGQTTDAAGNDLTQALKQQVYSGLPEQERQIRENASATGGTQRGSVEAALNTAGQKAATDVAQGSAELDAQAQQAKIQGLNAVYRMTNAQIQNTLGITKDELTQIYQSGNAEAINYINGLMGISQNQESQLVSVNELPINAALASETSDQAGKAALINSLLSAGVKAGTMAAA